MQDIISVSKREVFRAEIIQRTIERRLSQKDAAVQLNISERQVRRLVSSYRSNGIDGLISKKRGAKSNRALPKSFIECAIAYIRSNYSDFGPTLAAEKLF